MMKEEYRGFQIVYSESDKAFYIEGDNYSQRTIDLDLLKKKINQLLAKKIAEQNIRVFFGWDIKEFETATLTSIDEKGEFWIKTDKKLYGSDRRKERVVYLDNENNKNILEEIKKVQEKKKLINEEESLLWAKLEKPSLIKEKEDLK